MAEKMIVSDLRNAEHEAISLLANQHSEDSVATLMKANAVYNRAVYLLIQTRQAFQEMVPVRTSKTKDGPITSLARRVRRTKLDDRIAAILGEEKFCELSLAYWTTDMSSDAVLDYVASHPIAKEDRDRRKAIHRAINARGWGHEANVMIDLVIQKHYSCMTDVLNSTVSEADLLCTRAEIDQYGEHQCLWIHGQQRVARSIPKR